MFQGWLCQTSCFACRASSWVYYFHFAKVVKFTSDVADSRVRSREIYHSQIAASSSMESSALDSILVVTISWGCESWAQTRPIVLCVCARIKSKNSFVRTKREVHRWQMTTMTTNAKFVNEVNDCLYICLQHSEPTHERFEVCFIAVMKSINCYSHDLLNHDRNFDWRVRREVCF